MVEARYTTKSSDEVTPDFRRPEKFPGLPINAVQCEWGRQKIVTTEHAALGIHPCREACELVQPRASFLDRLEKLAWDRAGQISRLHVETTIISGRDFQSL